MLLLISPAKKLDENPLSKNLESLLSIFNYKKQKPIFTREIKYLVDILKTYSVQNLEKLFGVSQNIAELNHKRYQEFSAEYSLQKGAKPAIFMFKGEVYSSLDAETLSKDDVKFAEENLCILSGLYGILKPLDLMQPYRLEMGTDLKNKNGKNLYDFWKNKITDQINNSEQDIIINLASKEYFKSVVTKNLKGKLINVSFKENKNGIYKTIGILAKKARGAMARFIITNKIETLAELKKFNNLNYKFNDELSSEIELIFTR